MLHLARHCLPFLSMASKPIGDLTRFASHGNKTKFHFWWGSSKQKKRLASPMKCNNFIASLMKMYGEGVISSIKALCNLEMRKFVVDPLTCDFPQKYLSPASQRTCATQNEIFNWKLYSVNWCAPRSSRLKELNKKVFFFVSLNIMPKKLLALCVHKIEG